MMTNKGKALKTVLRSNELFSELSDEYLDELLKIVDTITLKQNEILFKLGDLPDGLYVVMEGKLSAYYNSLDQLEVSVGEVGVGEVVGELGVLSDRTRSLTVKALESCELIKLSKEGFDVFCQHHPKFLINVTKLIVTRSQKVIRNITKHTHHTNVGLFILTETGLVNHFMTDIIEYLKNHKRYVYLTKEKVRKDSAKETIKKYEKAHDLVVFQMDVMDKKWNDVCIKHCKEIYIIADSEQQWARDKISINNQLKQLTEKGMICNLILLYRNRKHKPNNTRLWLNKGFYSRHYHLFVDGVEEVYRFLRIITRREVGVVLSGGGARGWAQLGALRALLRSKIPIDCIGGTSIGGLVAGCYATSATYREFLTKFERFMQSNVKLISLTSLTLPVISILDGRLLTRTIRDIFHRQLIEDLLIPFFCISSDISLAEQRVHKVGELWKYIRASVSIPGLMPPVVDNGNLLVDGGMCNNLPVDVMREEIGEYGTIIAIDISAPRVDYNSYLFPPELPIKDMLLKQVRIMHRDYKMPNIVDTIMNAMQLSSAMKTKINALGADVLISPDLGGYGLLDRSNWSAIKAVGYNKAMEVISTDKIISKLKT